MNCLSIVVTFAYAYPTISGTMISMSTLGTSLSRTSSDPMFDLESLFLLGGCQISLPLQQFLGVMPTNLNLFPLFLSM